jgi:mRNA-degrading endonuclease RelE of RelBE toxin-antitoxin system
MTVVGAGGIHFDRLAYTVRFQREYKKLESQIQERVDGKVRDLRKNPFPAGLAFEKLKGHSNPDIYTVHVDGNYKMSLHVMTVHEMEKKGFKEVKVAKTVGVLRRVGSHNEIDRKP